MSRYAKANQTIDDLKTVIRKTAIRGSDDGRLTTYCDDEEHPLWDLFKGSASATIYKDLSKIEVDTENVDYIGEYEMPGAEDLEHFEMIGTGVNAFPVAWCACGGDWENPLVFVLYIGQKGELRAYIPKDGNVYNKKTKAAYGNGDDDPCWDDDPDNPLLRFDSDKLRADVAGRITVKGAVEEKKKNTKAGSLTFRQLIQSLKDYDDQYSSVMPYADGAEAPCWGIQYIWFNDGILYLGQHDDEGLTCDTIAERIEECLPKEMLDYPAVVKIGTVSGDEDNRQIYDVDGEPASARTVSTSEVKANTYDPDDEFDDEFAEDGEDDSWFCKWVLKFA